MEAAEWARLIGAGILGAVASWTTTRTRNALLSARLSRVERSLSALVTLCVEMALRLGVGPELVSAVRGGLGSAAV